MSKTTRSPEKARLEKSSRRVAKEKNSAKKSSIAPASKKQTADQTPSVQATRNSTENKITRRESAAREKSARPSQFTAQVSHKDTSQLLRRTKTTASALAQLEKGIESIYRKDFKKAFAELKSLIEKYPNETEITASARSYIDICIRNEARHKKPAMATHNQTYAMGIMEHNKANYDKAIAHFQQSLEKYPCADYIYYSIAASLALKGDVSAAIENLRKAVELNRDSRIHAKNDPDFTALEGNTEFFELIGAFMPRQV